MDLQEAARQLNEDIAKINFPEFIVYNPLEYAWGAYSLYCRKFGRPDKKVVFVGMNPGPWGMAQTGVPFGEVEHVKQWLDIECPIGQPPVLHPKRPVEGFNVTRREVSGKRVWSLMHEKFGLAENFFADHFVTNYCPLIFFDADGRNITPDKLPVAIREPLNAACDKHMLTIIDYLKPQWLIGFGMFARKRLEQIQLNNPTQHIADCEIEWVLHPSPASPAANRGWADAATKKLVELGIWQTE